MSPSDYDRLKKEYYMKYTWKLMDNAPLNNDEILILFDSASVKIVRLCWWNDGGSEQNGFDGECPECIGWWTYENSVTQIMIDTDIMNPIGWMPFYDMNFIKDSKTL